MIRRRRRYASLLEGEGHDPLASVANLFDVAMVFAVALLMAFAANTQQEKVESTDAVETLAETGERRVGDGQRLGLAYRLRDGSIVYVPD